MRSVCVTCHKSGSSTTCSESTACSKSRTGSKSTARYKTGTATKSTALSKSGTRSKTRTGSKSTALSKSGTRSKTETATTACKSTTHPKLEVFVDDVSSEEESVVSHPSSASTLKSVTVTTRFKSRTGSKTGTVTTGSKSTALSKSRTRSKTGTATTTCKNWFHADCLAIPVEVFGDPTGQWFVSIVLKIDLIVQCLYRLCFLVNMVG